MDRESESQVLSGGGCVSGGMYKSFGDKKNLQRKKNWRRTLADYNIRIRGVETIWPEGERVCHIVDFRSFLCFSAQFSIIILLMQNRRDGGRSDRLIDNHLFPAARV